MSTNYYGNKKKRDDSPEVRFVLAIVRGLLWLVMLPFGGLTTKNKPSVRRAQPLDTEAIAKQWADTQTTVGLGGITHFGSAVVSADKLLDHVLRQKGYAGETMGDRLKSAQDDLAAATYHRVWQAHKLRNQLVHEVDSAVASFQIREAMQTYEDALKELGGLR